MTAAPPQPLPDLNKLLNEIHQEHNKIALSKDGYFLSFQGEGPYAGRRTLFLRLAGCNYTCSWCDTAYTWDWKRFKISDEVNYTSVYTLAEQVEDIDCRSLTITGGEPFLQMKAIEKFLLLTRTHWDEVHFETNGSVFPYWGEILFPYHYVVSPKLKNSGSNRVLFQFGKSINQLRLFASNHVKADVDWKFVCSSISDLNEVEETISMVTYLGSASPDWPRGVSIPNNRVWIMPEGANAQHIAATALTLANEVLKRGWNLTLRNHISIWGNARAR